MQVFMKAMNKVKITLACLIDSEFRVQISALKLSSEGERAIIFYSNANIFNSNEEVLTNPCIQAIKVYQGFFKFQQTFFLKS